MYRGIHKPQFYYIEVGCKGVYITRTRFHDVILMDTNYRGDANGYEPRHKIICLRGFDQVQNKPGCTTNEDD